MSVPATATETETTTVTEIPDEIVKQALITKKGIYSEVYDINSEKDYEGDIGHTENKYLNSLGKIHRILIGILGGAQLSSMESIGELSAENNTEIKKLGEIVEKNRKLIEDEQLKDFIDNYFFKYPWWLGETRVD